MTDLMALETRELTVEREGRNILDSVSVAVPRGSFTSIVGPNGAGKSTLVRAMCGLLEPTGGEVMLLGKPLGGYSRRETAQRISYVPQSPPTAIPFTVREFVSMARYAHGSRLGGLDASGRAAVDESLSLTGCDALANRTMHTLSGGEARKVHLAAALAQGGEVLVLDEPTTHLDYRHQREVLSLLRKAHEERGLTIIAVLHDLNQGVSHSDMAIAMKGGRVFHSGAPSALVHASKLAELFDTEFHVIEQPGMEALVVARHD